MSVIDAEVETLPLRTRARRSVFWIVVAVVAVLGAVLTVVLGGGAGSDTGYLSIENAGASGSRAVAEVLRQQGVDVVRADSLDEAEQAVQDADGPATLLVSDTAGYLDDARLDRLADLAAGGTGVVLVEPVRTELDALAPGVEPAGAAEENDSVSASCTLPAAERAGSISQPYAAYRVLGAAAAFTCFPSGDDAFSLVGVTTGSGSVTVLGAGDALTNDVIVQRGNAALALGLLGERETLVWYLPTAEDLDGGAPDTLGSLTPGWVTPVILLLMLVVVAAGVWRGRRFGPVVVENLPVTVRASETMEGRARLYAKQSAHLRALDALRVGTVQRLTGMLALPRQAGLVEVSRSVAAITGRSVDEVHHLLVGAEPRSEAELMQLSDGLLVLERQVRAATGLR
ncbi:MAG: DUF4350 domain-containing protein [Herbiconiux sp.]|nr:DUF4350 domain-containing protein [Herbiconiux sp.]